MFNRETDLKLEEKLTRSLWRRFLCLAGSGSSGGLLSIAQYEPCNKTEHLIQLKQNMKKSYLSYLTRKMLRGLEFFIFCSVCVCGGGKEGFPPNY